jgi:hypothetical protein
VEGANLKRHLTGILQGVSEGAILEAKRLGARRPGAHRPRPILARFIDSDRKHAAFENGRDLRRDNVFVDDDLTPGQQEARFQQRGRYAELRQQGCNNQRGLLPFLRLGRTQKYGVLKD